MDRKMIVRACLLYDFKLKKSAAESYPSSKAAFGEEVVSKRQCERWFQRFAAGDESLEDEKHGRPAPILDSDLSRTTVEADPTRSTGSLHLLSDAASSDMRLLSEVEQLVELWKNRRLYAYLTISPLEANAHK
ncbi:unnamed protein product [Heligmosomoides polygyrus]|uniref:HTH_48 domain-containing protein n=1 Tax=Heligmosomoides polygyrus TaxID=6339 RepID=A0A183FSH6_HELPZ|nr:unnamed protein product [Heligmosomoides polygyrus]